MDSTHQELHAKLVAANFDFTSFCDGIVIPVEQAANWTLDDFVATKTYEMEDLLWMKMVMCFQNTQHMGMSGIGTESWIGVHGDDSSTHYNVVERGEQPEVIVANIQKHLPSWADAVHDL